jgi:hypothetical protein
MKVLCGKVACLHRNIPLCDFVWGDQSAVHPSSDGHAAPVRCIVCRRVGHTRVVAYASIASYVFTQLIQRPEVEQRRLSACPGYGTEGSRYASSLSLGTGMQHRDAPTEDVLRYSTCTILCHQQQDSRWVCDESEFLKCRSFPFRWRFLVTIYKSSMPTHRAWPKHACIFRLGSHLELSSKPNQWCHKTR